MRARSTSGDGSGGSSDAGRRPSGSDQREMKRRGQGSGALSSVDPLVHSSSAVRARSREERERERERNRNASDGSAASAASMSSGGGGGGGMLAPFHWSRPLMSAAAVSAASSAPYDVPLLRSTPQIVLQNPGAMVVYDPPAHELVVYKHGSPVLTGATADMADMLNRAAGGGMGPPGSLAASGLLQPRQQQQGLQAFQMGMPFATRTHMGREEEEMQSGNVCRLCRRPFWPQYPFDVDEDYGETVRHFTSSDYFHLLHATEQAAAASREHGARFGGDEELKGEGTRRGRRRRRERRGSVSIVEEPSDEPSQPSNVAGSSTATQRAPSIVRARQGRSSRAGIGMRIRQQRAQSDEPDTGGSIPVSSSVEEFSTTQTEAVDVSDDSDGVEIKAEADSASVGGSSSAAAASAAEADDDVLECGLHRSSFNSGYYAKFFREERKLGAGGVGGVFLTHHVLDNVTLGTYAVKKIPVGNCVSDEHQLLTAEGFLYYDQIVSRLAGDGSSLLVACFDAASRCIIYAPITAAEVVSRHDSVRLVDFVSSPDEDQTRDSGSVNLRVTEEHEMYVRHGRTSQATEWAQQGGDVAQYHKAKAGDLLAQAQHDATEQMRIGMLGRAEGGFAAPGSDEPLPFSASLGFTKEEEEDAFLELYGYWLGVGSIDSSDSSLLFSPGDDAAARHLEALLARLSLQPESDALPDTECYSRAGDKGDQGRAIYRVLSPRWKTYFAEEYGREHDGARDQRLWWWVLQRLNKRQLRLVARGLRFADGDGAGEGTPDRSGCIRTTSVRFRDELVIMLLHAGYSAHFRLQAPNSEQTGAVNGSIDAMRDTWLVCYSEHGQAAEPTLHAKRDVSAVRCEEPVHTWCVSVPHRDQLIIMRRVLDADKEGRVRQASQPIIMGNSRPWLLQVLKEVRALEGLHHRHIIAYKHSWLETFKPSDFGPEVPCLFLLMEWANRGTLADLIWPKVKAGTTGAAAARSRLGLGQVPPPHVMQEEEVWWVFIGTCLGLRHLHRAGVIHRDLKPENLLISSETDALGREHGIRVLVSDFGNAILKGVPYNRTGNTGTLAYSAPETLVPQPMAAYAARFSAHVNSPGVSVSPSSSPTPSLCSAAAAASSGGGGAGIAGAGAGGSGGGGDSSRPLAVEYDEACDLWGLGVILYAMAFGTLPFVANSPDALFAEIRGRGGDALQLPSHPPRSPEMKTIIRQLLSLDPAQRPRLDELLMRPSVIKRREQRYAESTQQRQQTRQQESGGVVHRRTELTETYRPPMMGRAGHELVISPSLLAAPRHRERSASPAPLSLNPPASTPSLSSSPSDSPVSGVAPRSIREREGQAAPRSLSPSTALILSSLAVVEAGDSLPWPLRALLALLNIEWQAMRPFVAAATGRPRVDVPSCWRCVWGPTAEGLAHLLVFLIKLWLAVVMLLSNPSSSSIYLHVFPQVLLSLLLFFTTPLAFTAQWLRLSVAALDERSKLRRLVRRLHRWGRETPLQWQLVRTGASMVATGLTTAWLLVGEGKWSLHALNVTVGVAQCGAILATFLVAHSSHDPAHSRARGAAGQTPAVAVSGLRSKLVRSLSPITVVRGAASSAGSSVSSSAPGAVPAEPVSGASTPVARVPLLLPPDYPSGNPVAYPRARRHALLTG